MLDSPFHMTSRFPFQCVGRLLFLIGLIAATTGCRTTAPVHVWVPPAVPVAPKATVALMPVSAHPELATRLQDQLLAQRPAAKADVALFTSEQLHLSSPVRLASTAAMSSDHLALNAARTMDADLLLKGDVLSETLKWDAIDSGKPTNDKPVDWNQVFFQRAGENSEDNESLLLTWRVIDVETGKTLDAYSVNLNTEQAREQYPDLSAMHQEDPTQLLIAASAREAWKLLSPTVVKDEVDLAKPWLQLGAWRTRQGVKAAKKGDWRTAEAHFEKAARFPFNAAAQHNLAIALAAKEDFQAAKQQLKKVRGPFSSGMPAETLFWLDQRHRVYHEAHGLPTPLGGWTFPDYQAQPIEHVEPVDLEDLPWWTAIPLTKPPGWRWKDWLTQPVVF